MIAMTKNTSNEEALETVIEKNIDKIMDGGELLIAIDRMEKIIDKILNNPKLETIMEKIIGDAVKTIIIEASSEDRGD